MGLAEEEQVREMNVESSREGTHLAEELQDCTPAVAVDHHQIRLVWTSLIGGPEMHRGSVVEVDGAWR